MDRDFMLMCKNAQNYNEESSLIYEDSVALLSVFTNARQRVEEEPEESQPMEQANNEEDAQPSESDDSSNTASSAVKKLKIGKGKGNNTSSSEGNGKRGKRKGPSRKYEEDDLGEEEARSE